MASEETTTIGRAGLISLAAAGGAIAGFFLQLIVAYHFGADTTTDAFFMAQSVGELVSKLLLGGSIAAVALPIFVERLTRGKKDDAWELGNNLLHITTVVLLVLVALIIFLAEPLVGFIAPGFDAATTALTVQLLRVLAPSFLLLFMVDLVTSLLHALERFNAAASLRLVAPTVSIIFLLSFAQLGIFAWAIGVVVGSFIQLVVLIRSLLKQGWKYKFVFKPTDSDIKQLATLAAPFILSMLVTQAAGILYRVLVSDLAAGSLTSLKFSEKITQLITIMFLNSVTIVIFPLLSKKAAQKDFVGVRDTIGSSIRLIVFTTLPIIIGVAMLRVPLISLVFERGSFTADDAALTSTALLFMIIGLTTNGISSVLGHAVVAMKKTKAAVAVTILSQFVSIGLFLFLVPKMQHAGLALTASLTPLAIATMYFVYLKRYIPELGKIFQHKTLPRVFALAAALFVAVFFAQQVTASLHQLLQVIIATIAGAVVYLSGAHLWKIPEMNQVTEIVSKKFYAFRSR